MRGADILTMLHQKSLSLKGDEQGEKLCVYLAYEAAVPYMDSLRHWIASGVVIDPFDEVGR